MSKIKQYAELIFGEDNVDLTDERSQNGMV